tara:strand:+ start:2963 stop:4069 length:1107 start_codon:yes stop_codon:yes gene_type:complete
MKVLVTGANGFIGSNLVSRFQTEDNIEVIKFTRQSSIEELSAILSKVDFVCHAAGVNRPKDEDDFDRVNADLTKRLCIELQKVKKNIPIIFTSSVHVKNNNKYGASKLTAEKYLIEYSEKTNTPVYIFRLPHVIGKWCRPDYNSVVSTFCHNIARNIPIQINDPSYQLNLVYIDDFIDTILKIFYKKSNFDIFCEVNPTYPINVGDLAKLLYAIKSGKESLIIENVGKGILRALYSTYVSYLPIEDWSYKLEKHEDERGAFVEFMKTKDSGQFSFFTAHPGVTRGGHYHHTKTEKFLVVKGKAVLNFRNIVTNEKHKIFVSSSNPEVVETIPGWAHDIKNIGDEEMIVMIWANEVFDLNHPDTFYSNV